MKILQINSVSNFGSTGRTAKEISDYCLKLGHISVIAYSTGEPVNDGYKIGFTLEKKMHAFLSRLTGLQGYFSKISTNNLIQFIKEFNPDVIRLGNLHSNFINIPRLLTFISQNDIPTVITLDDCFFYTGKCCHYTVDGCLKWKSGCGDCIRLKKDNCSWFFDRTNKMWNEKKALYESIPRLAVVGVSDWITKEASSSILSSAKYIQRIYNWIDIDLFRQVDTTSLKRKLDLENKFIILGVATEWSASKGLNEFIELSNLIKNNQIIVLVGKIPTEFKLSDNIIQLPITNDVNKLVEYYSMADVFIQLSKEESFGKVTAEALSCGTPVIVYNSTANPELVGEKCGYITKKNNITEVNRYINKIQKLGKNYYSENCRNFAVRLFDKEKNIEEYVKLFNLLIEAKGDL